MFREARLEHVAAVRDYAVAYLSLDTALKRTRTDRRASDYGPWAFISVFGDDDIEEFLQEINEAIVRAVSGEDNSGVEELIRQWQMSARTMSDPVAREILSGSASEAADFIEATDAD